MSTQNDIISLEKRLKSLRNYVLFWRIVIGVTITGSALFALLLIANVLNATFHLPVWFRVAFSSIGVSLLLFLLYTKLVAPLIFRPSLEKISLLVETRYPHLKNRLIASLQLEKHLRVNTENFSVDMIKELISQTSGAVDKLDVRASYSNSEFKKSVKYFGGLFAVIVVIAIISPGLFWSSIQVFSHPLTEIEIPRTYTIEVLPGTTEILKYDPLDVTVVLRGEKLPESAEIFWDFSEEGGNWRSDKLDRVTIPGIPSDFKRALGVGSDSVAFSYSFKDIKHGFKYFVRAGREESGEFAVSVVDKPRITDFKLTYVYPKYTRLKPLVVDENDGNVQAIKGTRIKVELTSSKTVESGGLLFSDGKTVELECDDTRLTASFVVTSNKSYHAQVVDGSGYNNPNPIEYRITMLEDAPPEIYMVNPAGNVDLDDMMAVKLMANIADDFGFTKLVLHYVVHLTSVEQWEEEQEIQISNRKTEQQVEYFWDLANSGLLPGSWIEYYLEVFDNDYISGPKSTKGPVMAVRLPTLDEMFVEIESSREDQIEQFIESLKQQKELDDRFEELNQELQLEKELDWEAKKDIEEAVSKQHKLVDNFDKLAKQFEEINQNARENQLLTLQMIQKINELQKLFNEVATPEMREALKKLQEALDSMDKDKIEDALKDMEFSMEDVLKNIERAIAQLKQLQVEQKMQDMIRRAEELLKNQQSVNKQTERGSEDELPDLAPKERSVRSDLEQLKREADQLDSLLTEAGLEKNNDAKKFSSATKESGAEENMEDMIAQLSDKEKQSASSSGEMSEKKLSQMLEQMRQSQSSMTQQMGSELAEKMRKALDDIFYLSDKQEDLYGRVQRQSGESADLRAMAEEQMKLQSHASWLNDYLFELSKESACMQRRIGQTMRQCLNNMGQSTEALSEMKGQISRDRQKEAMFSMNQASRMIMEALNSQKQCNSSCSNPNSNMFKKMSQMCQNQKRINQKTESMCNNPNQVGPGQKEAMERLAMEQSAIRKSVQEMQQEFGDRKQIKGRLQNLSEEMQNVVESLEEGGVGEQTLDRQRRIYQRMLDFQLSMERQDYSEMRQAERTEQILRRGPEPLNPESRAGAESYEKRLQKFLQEGYPPEYESIIKDYFKAIMEVNE